MRMSMCDAMELARIVNEKMQISRPRLGMKLGRSAPPKPSFPEPKFIDHESQCMLEMKWVQAVAALPRELRDEIAADTDTGEVARLFLIEIGQREDRLIRSISRGILRIRAAQKPE